MSDWMPGRFWRVVYGTDARVWCETSDEQEARDALATCPGGGILERQYTSSVWRWVE